MSLIPRVDFGLFLDFFGLFMSGSRMHRHDVLVQELGRLVLAPTKTGSSDNAVRLDNVRLHRKVTLFQAAVVVADKSRKNPLGSLEILATQFHDYGKMSTDVVDHDVKRLYEICLKYESELAHITPRVHTAA